MRNKIRVEWVILIISSFKIYLLHPHFPTNLNSWISQRHATLNSKRVTHALKPSSPIEAYWSEWDLFNLLQSREYHFCLIFYWQMFLSKKNIMKKSGNCWCGFLEVPSEFEAAQLLRDHFFTCCLAQSLDIIAVTSGIRPSSPFRFIFHMHAIWRSISIIGFT